MKLRSRASALSQRRQSNKSASEALSFADQNRVDDEYQAEFFIPQKRSLRPLSLRELIQFLDAIEHPEADLSWKRFGFVLSYNQCNLDCGSDLEDLRAFTNVSSDFCDDLGSHYRQAIEEWYSDQERGIQT
jgi:hypothetical protein